MVKHLLIGLSLLYFNCENLLADDASEAKGLEVAKIIEEAGKNYGSDSSDMEMILIDAHGSKVSRSLISK